MHYRHQLPTSNHLPSELQKSGISVSSGCAIVLIHHLIADVARWIRHVTVEDHLGESGASNKKLGPKSPLETHTHTHTKDMYTWIRHNCRSPHKCWIIEWSENYSTESSMNLLLATFQTQDICLFDPFRKGASIHQSKSSSPRKELNWNFCGQRSTNTLASDDSNLMISDDIIWYHDFICTPFEEALHWKKEPKRWIFINLNLLPSLIPQCFTVSVSPTTSFAKLQGSNQRWNRWGSPLQGTMTKVFGRKKWQIRTISSKVLSRPGPHEKMAEVSALDESLWLIGSVDSHGAIISLIFIFWYILLIWTVTVIWCSRSCLCWRFARNQHLHDGIL